MSHPHLCALVATALLVVGCSREPANEPAAPAATPAPAAAEVATPAEPAAERVFAVEELDQMVAPIALYPDPLLAQVLMAATYPGDVADAAKWSAAHPDANGDAAVKQVADQPWDPSVQSLVAFPQVLATLEQDPAWVTRLGDAFLAQPDEVMDAVQRLRRQAKQAGNLSSNQYQQVSEQAVEAAPTPAPAAGQATTVIQQPAEQVIVIEPSDPQTVYVPSYNPTTAYGTWSYPSYPPAYYPPPRRYYPVGEALVAGMAFGVGVAVIDALWGEPHWGYHDDHHHGGWGGGHNYIDIDVGHYNNIHGNHRINGNQAGWRHDPIHRDGVPYRDLRSRQEYGRNLDGAHARDAFRGDDRKRAEQRAKARNALDSRGLQAAGSNREALDNARKAVRDGGVSGSDARERAREVASNRAAGGGDARERAREVAGNRTAGSGDARERAREVASNRVAGSGDAREHAREVASNRAAGSGEARQRVQDAASNPQTRQKLQTAAHNAQDNPKAQQAARNLSNNPQARQAASQIQATRSSQANRQARTRERNQAAAVQRPAPGRNAFQGAGRPSASQIQTNRGHASQAAARRPAAARPAARPVQRPSQPPQRAGARHR